jgi:hypothetical protein
MSLDAEDEVAVLIRTQTLELSAQPFSHGNLALAHGLRVERADGYQDRFKVYVGPGQAENLAAAHTRIQGADQNRSQLLSLTEAGSQESPFLLSANDSLSWRLFSGSDQRLSVLKRVPQNPAIRERNIQDPTHYRDLAVHSCDRAGAFPRLALLVGTFRIASKNDRSFRSMGPISLQIAVNNRA